MIVLLFLDVKWCQNLSLIQSSFTLLIMGGEESVPPRSNPSELFLLTNFS